MYFLSKLICEVVPMKALPISVFCTITYWMIGALWGHYRVVTSVHLRRDAIEICVFCFLKSLTFFSHEVEYKIGTLNVKCTYFHTHNILTDLIMPHISLSLGLSPSLSSFLLYMFTTFLTSLSGTAVALLFSATAGSHTIGTVLTAMVWVFMMVYSGLLVNINTIHASLRWIKWISIFRYSMNVSIVIHVFLPAEKQNFTDIITFKYIYIFHSHFVRHSVFWS